MGGSPSRSSRIDTLAAIFGADPNDAEWSRLAGAYLQMLDIKASMAVSRKEELSPAIVEIIAAGDRVLLLAEKALRKPVRKDTDWVGAPTPGKKLVASSTLWENDQVEEEDTINDDTGEEGPRRAFDSVGMSGRGKGGFSLSTDFAIDEGSWKEDTKEETREKIIELEIRLFELHYKIANPDYVLDNSDDNRAIKNTTIGGRYGFLYGKRTKLYAILGIENVIPPPAGEDLIEDLRRTEDNDSVVGYYPYLSREELSKLVDKLKTRISKIREFVNTKGKTDLDENDPADEEFSGVWSQYYSFDSRISAIQGWIAAANDILNPGGSSKASSSKTEVVLSKATPAKRAPKSSASSKKINWTHAYSKVDITIKNDATGERRTETINIKFWTIRQYRHYAITPPGEYRELFPTISEYVTKTFEGYSFDRSVPVKERKYVEIKEGRGFTPLAILVGQDGEVSLGTIKRVTLAVVTKSSPQATLITRDFESDEAMETSLAQGFKDVLPEEDMIVVHNIYWLEATGRQLPYNATI